MSEEHPLFDIHKIEKNRSLQLAIAVDVIMLGLVSLNLLLILFNEIFASTRVQTFLESNTQVFFNFYDTYIFKDFILIDAIFLSIFIAEFFIRWAIAIYKKTHYRWFFFPFIHWYDVLGCIPINSFRFFRILRVFSILFRLQKNDVLDLTDSYLVSFAKKYYTILVEEITDRVVVNVISGIQEEVKEGTPLTDQIVKEVLQPKREILIEWLSDQTRQVSQSTYDENKENIKIYVESLITRAVEQNKELHNIERIPMLGNLVSTTIENAIKDIVFNVIQNFVNDLGSENNKLIVGGVTDLAFDIALSKEENEVLNQLTTEMMTQSLEIVKNHVKVQKWKERVMPDASSK